MRHILDEPDQGRAERRPVVITLANQKGGCGKTTASLNLAAALTFLGLRTCLADCDPQANASRHLGLDVDAHAEAGRPTMVDVLVGHVPAREAIIRVAAPDSYDGPPIRPDLIPGHRGLGMVERYLDAQSALKQPAKRSAEQGGQFRRLRVALSALSEHYDVVILDTGPTLNFLLTVSLVAADYVIIPTFPNSYDLSGLEELMQTLDAIRGTENPDLTLLGVLVGQFKGVPKLDRELLTLLRGQFDPQTLFDQVISENVRLREAPFQHLTVFEHAPAQTTANQFVAIATQLLARVGLAKAVAA